MPPSLLDRVNAQRSTPLARYVGMDAAAQELADNHAPCSQGPYAAVVCGYGDPAPNMLNPAYSKVGIGVNGGYTVVFLNY